MGEFRDMIDSFENTFNPTKKGFIKPVKVTWVTGILAYKLLEEKIVNPLRQIKNLK